MTIDINKKRSRANVSINVSGLANAEAALRGIAKEQERLMERIASALGQSFPSIRIKASPEMGYQIDDEHLVALALSCVIKNVDPESKVVTRGAAFDLLLDEMNDRGYSHGHAGEILHDVSTIYERWLAGESWARIEKDYDARLVKWITDDLWSNEEWLRANTERLLEEADAMSRDLKHASDEYVVALSLRWLIEGTKGQDLKSIDWRNVYAQASTNLANDLSEKGYKHEWKDTWFDGAARVYLDYVNGKTWRDIEKRFDTQLVKWIRDTIDPRRPLRATVHRVWARVIVDVMDRFKTTKEPPDISDELFQELDFDTMLDGKHVVRFAIDGHVYGGESDVSEADALHDLADTLSEELRNG